MKVLMFGWEFPPHISGGLGTACFRITEGLVKQGAKILFVVPHRFEDEKENGSKILGANEVKFKLSSTSFIHKSPILRKYLKNLSFIEINSFLVPYIGGQDYYNITNYNKEYSQTTNHFTQQRQNEFRNFEFIGGYGQNLLQEVEKYALVASQIAKDYDFDVIHAHDWLTYKAGIVAKKISGKPLVIHVHATEFDRSGENVNQTVYDIEKEGMTEADHIITVSNYTKRIVVNRYAQPLEKITTIYNGIEEGEKNIKKLPNHFKKKIVTFLGRVTFQKGPDYFVEAAEKVIKKDPNIIFVLAGSGDMLNRMIALVGKKRISKNFFFTGFLKGKDVEKMFRMSDVYVMPSVSEPFGISPLEAMREGVPTIISKQSGVSEVVSYAIKVDFWDIDAMADAIYSLTHYSAISNMITKNASEELHKINWDKATREILDVYNKVSNQIVAK
ncbi:MAG: glycosyltransferase family 4 protein [Bacteroidota bacterium]|nr:glycosyltransferase family 4 protein [Bacteroidota bacterium]